MDKPDVTHTKNQLLAGNRITSAITLDKLGVEWLLKTASIERTLPTLQTGMSARKLALKLADLLRQPSTYKIPKTFDRAEFLKDVSQNLPELKTQPRIIANRYGHDLIPINCQVSLSPTGQKWIEPDPHNDFLLSLVECCTFSDISNKHYLDGPKLFRFIWDIVPNKSIEITNDLCWKGKALQRKGIIPSRATDKYGLQLLDGFPEINTSPFLINSYRFFAWETFKQGWEKMQQTNPQEANSIAKQILCKNTQCIAYMPSEFYKGAQEAFIAAPPELPEARCLGGANLLKKGLIEIHEVEQFIEAYKVSPDVMNAKIMEFAIKTVERTKLLNAPITEVTEIDMF